MGVQTKLTVNEPGDVWEQEADRIANQVMATSSHQAVSAAPPRIQRFSGQEPRQGSSAPASIDRTLAGPGRPLESGLREEMEHRFGYDFSRVRVHTGPAAAQSARDINAHAYTVGGSIVFGAEFTPGTHEGRRLLAHELTHVVQQSGTPANVVRRSNGFEDEPTLVEGSNPHRRDPNVGWRGHVERGGEKIPGNIASGEIVEKPPGPTSGGGGGGGSTAKAAQTEGKVARAAKVTRALSSAVAELPKVGALNAVFFYLDLHAAHFAALDYVRQRAEAAEELIAHVAEFEKSARALRGAVNDLERYEAALPGVTKILESGEQSLTISLEELEYIDAYAASAAKISGAAFDARFKLNKIIAGWDAVVALGQSTRDFTRKAIMETALLLDFRFSNEGGSFRNFLIAARDDAGRVEAWAGSKWHEAKDIVRSANLPLRRVQREIGSIRNDLLGLTAEPGGASAGVLVAIDYLKVARDANDTELVLDSVNHSLSVLNSVSGVFPQKARLSLLKGKLQELVSD